MVRKKEKTASALQPSAQVAIVWRRDASSLRFVRFDSLFQNLISMEKDSQR